MTYFIGLLYFTLIYFDLLYGFSKCFNLLWYFTLHDPSSPSRPSILNCTTVPVMQPVSQSARQQSISQSASHWTSQPATQPVSQPLSQSASYSASQPATQPISQPPKPFQPNVSKVWNCHKNPNNSNSYVSKVWNCQKKPEKPNFSESPEDQSWLEPLDLQDSLRVGFLWFFVTV